MISLQVDKVTFYLLLISSSHTFCWETILDLASDQSISFFFCVKMYETNNFIMETLARWLKNLRFITISPLRQKFDFIFKKITLES